jgi:hypothetical protein
MIIRRDCRLVNRRNSENAKSRANFSLVADFGAACAGNFPELQPIAATLCLQQSRKSVRSGVVSFSQDRNGVVAGSELVLSGMEPTRPFAFFGFVDKPPFSL